MNRLYVVESTATPTGAKADHLEQHRGAGAVIPGDEQSPEA
jgi:hypothetical protein